MTVEDQDPIALTRRWLERAVIGLNLCPFAKAVHAKSQIRFVLSEATTPEALLEELVAELAWLRDADPQSTDTTLLIHPQVLNDFIDYNDFLDAADAAIEALDLEGVLQVASFHPDYQFAGTAPDDIGNCSNRSPVPHPAPAARSQRLARSRYLPRRGRHRRSQPRRVGEAGPRCLARVAEQGWLTIQHRRAW